MGNTKNKQDVQIDAALYEVLRELAFLAGRATHGYGKKRAADGRLQGVSSGAPSPLFSYAR